VPNAWWLCPNTPPCGHGAVLHDIEDYDDEHPRCGVEGCDCGDPLATPEPAPQRRQRDPSLLMEEPDLYPKAHDPDDERHADAAHMAAGEAWMEHDAEQGEGDDRG
jgi:hypothetical protein